MFPKPSILNLRVESSGFMVQGFPLASKGSRSKALNRELSKFRVRHLMIKCSWFQVLGFRMKYVLGLFFLMLVCICWVLPPLSNSWIINRI